MNLSSFASLFPFRTLGATQSSINTLLDSKDVTLEKLLDEESFGSQFKSQNSKLMQFLKYDKYKDLIEYITTVGPEDDNKRSCKFPFVAAQVLTNDNNTLIDYLLPEKELFIEEEHVNQVEVEEEFEVEDENPQSEQSGEEISLQQPVSASSDNQVKETKEQQTQKGEGQQTKASQESQQQVTQQKATAQDKDQQQPEQKSQQAESVEQEEKKPATKIQKRIVKKQVVTKVMKQVQPLIGDLFAYLDEQLNYVLAGYFSKVVTNLFSKKTTSLTNYIFQEGRYLKFLKHIGSRSIAQLISKILTLDTCNYLQERQQILNELLKLLSQPWGDDINTPVNISFVLCDVIQKSAAGVKTNQGAKQLLTHIYAAKFCQGLLNNVVSEVEQVAIYSSPVLLIALTSIRQLSENKEQCKNIELVQKYSQLMASLKFNLAQSSELSTIFKNFLIKAVDRLDSQQSRSTTLGLGRIKLIEALFYMLKFDLFSLKTTVPETKLFERLFGLMRKYHMNNVLHNEIVKTISFVLQTDEGASLIPNLFEEGKLIDFLYEQTEADVKIQQEIQSGKRGITRKGYIGHIVKIGQILKKLESNKTLLAVDEDKWTAIKSLVQTQTFETEKNLAGYTAKRGEQASNIMFSRQEILSYHHKFLSKPPITTYPPVQQSDQDQIDSAIKMFQQKLKITQDDKNKQTEVQHKAHHEQKTDQQKEQEKVIEQQRELEQEEGRQIHSLVGYWKNSKKMNYDLEDIMNDLN